MVAVAAVMLTADVGLSVCLSDTLVLLFITQRDTNKPEI